MPPTERQAPVFLYSPRHGEALGASVEASGRPVEHSGRASAAARRFARSPAVIALIDARTSPARALAVARALAPAVETRRGAMLVLAADDVVAAAAYDYGATHFLIAPVADAELAQALRYAERYVRRLQASGAQAAVVSAQAALSGSARWEWRRGASAVTVSPTLAAMIGEGPGEVPIERVLRRVPNHERLRGRAALRRLLVADVAGDVEHVMNIDGSPRTIVHHIVPQHDRRGRIVGVAATVEDLDAARLDQRLAAHFDPVTGLVNQRFAEAWVDQLLDGRSSVDPACAILLVAISRFEAINVGYGRTVGDAAMQDAGARIRSLAHAAPFVDRMIVARLAGAQFAVAVAGPVSETEMVEFAHAVGEAFERPFVIGGRVLHLSCRMGVALGEASLGSADALFRRASGALAIARRGEPNSFHVVPPGGADDGHARAAALEADLRQALGDADGAIEVLYQPQVEIVSSRITGVEALVRWRHPVLGPLSAETVLGVAEGAELMVRLSRHVMRKAFADAAAWTGELAALRLSVNVTAQDMRVADFEDSIVAALDESGLAANRLTLEITESGLVENVERAADTLARLRQRGIKVAIDDFGTGYSSLAYLKSLPLDTLKVDKSLVTDLAGTPRDRVVVSGVVDMARSLGMMVVAEGVETHRQLDLVVREGCNCYQGYLCAPPLTARELEAFVPGWQARAAA